VAGWAGRRAAASAADRAGWLAQIPVEPEGEIEQGAVGLSAGARGLVPVVRLGRPRAGETTAELLERRTVHGLTCLRRPQRALLRDHGGRHNGRPGRAAGWVWQGTFRGGSIFPSER